MKREDGIDTFHAKNRKEWRSWLEKNHQSEKQLWLIIYHQESKTPSVSYDEAVDEALCFGWIDSKPNKRNDESYFQFFSKRNPRSNWSKVNKEKIVRLMKADLMAPAGIELIQIAKSNGSWTALDEVEQLVVPQDLQKAFDLLPIAFKYWNNFPPSSKRGILEWIFNAKRSETRANRIRQTVELAAENIRANHYRQPKRK